MMIDKMLFWKVVMEKNPHLHTASVKLNGTALLQNGGYLSLRSATADFLMALAKQLS